MILLFLIWWAIGMSGFYYWSTKDRDLTTDEFPLFIVSGITGMFAWLIGWLIYAERNSDKVLFKKRNEDENE